MILAYSLLLNLLLLAAMMRLFDIAQRRSRRLDLRHLGEKLRDDDEEGYEAIVEQLKKFGSEAHALRN